MTESWDDTKTSEVTESDEAEILHAFDIDEPEFPGQDEVISIADEGCYNEFEGFIGMSYEYSEVYMSSMYPTQWTWLDGDREVLCIVYIPDEQVTGTLEGANR